MGYTKKELATVAGYTYRRLHDIDMGLPEGEKLFVQSEDGKYDLALFVQRWVKYNVGQEQGTDRTLDEVKADHEIVKMRKTELEVARMEGALVDVGEIRRLWASIAGTVTQNLLRLPSSVAPRLTMQKSPDVITAILDDEIRAALVTIADTPLPGNVQDAQEEQEDGQEE
ncbi:MAG: hypothetical protein ACI4PG_06510 [Candidatus Ventricola sp.]